MNIIERLNEEHPDKLRYFLSKAGIAPTNPSPNPTPDPNPNPSPNPIPNPTPTPNPSPNLSKADTVPNERDRQKVVVQITQNLSSR